MDPVFRWIEESAFSVWTRESTSVFAYPAFLSAHAIGMGLAAGVCIAMAFHLLGLAPAIPTRELRRLAPVLWAGFALNAVSGVILLIAYPTKALTNPLFFVKLALVGVGLWLYVRIHGRLPERMGESAATHTRNLRRMAAASLAVWAGAITAGRLLAYTFTRLFVDF
jgi:hypothetical protein